jgi:hypothetical protein
MAAFHPAPLSKRFRRRGSVPSAEPASATSPRTKTDWPVLRRIRFPRAGFALLALLVLVVGASACSSSSANGATGGATVQVSKVSVGPAVPSGFVGISMEYKGLEAYAGSNPRSVNGAFVQLLRNLSPSSGFVLRIGGDSTDWSWWPVPHLAKPGGVKYSLTPTWAGVAKAVATALKGHLILGVNFEADSRAVAATEASQLLNRVGRSSIEALELGNEPELYASFAWYKNAAGQKVYGRPRGYGAPQAASDFANIASALPSAPMAGPSAGSEKFLSSLGSFIARQSRLKLVTVHAYPLKHCVPTKFATASQLFQTVSLQGLANMIGGWVGTAHHHGLPLRVDEMNSVSCGGQRGLSNSFAPALWALEMLPDLVRAGVSGVNFHTVPGGNNALLAASESHGRWQVSTQPEYMGLLAFSQIAPAGSHLLRTSAPKLPDVDEWAAQSGGQTRVVFVNSGRSGQRLNVQVSGATGNGAITHLQASGLGATSGVTLDGQHLDGATGALSGAPAVTSVAPGKSGAYSISIPAHSATILTVAAS